MKNQSFKHFAVSTLLVHGWALLACSTTWAFGVQTFKSQYELKPFVTAASTSEQIAAGLNQLYATTPTTDTKVMADQMARTEEFQNFIYSTLNNAIQNQAVQKVQVTEKRLKGNFVMETTIKFPSLIQRPNNHASNQVVARIYRTTAIPQFCEYKFPTSIFLHHILNEVNVIEDVAKVISSGVLNQHAIIVVIHMPHYGERRQGNEEFLNPDWSQFRLNMAQLILDVHALKNYLDQSEIVDQNNLSLTGISLGAVMGLTVGAFDQSFSSYGFLVGGGDMPNILFNRAKNRPDSEVATALKGVTLTEIGIKNEIGSVDSITWMHRYQGKRIMMLNASRDDIVNYETSVRPIVNQFNTQNKVTHFLNDDEHSPTGGAFKKLKEVFLPLAKFVANEVPRLEQTCPVRAD